MKTLMAALCALVAAGCAPSLQTEHGAGALSARMTGTSTYPRLKRAIDECLPDSLFPPSNAAVRIVSLSRGETLYDLNGALAFNPASNEKLFTSACALDALGGAYAFRTRIFADTAAPPRIIVRGSGDPMLDTKNLDTLAAVLRATLPAESTWTIAGDIALFDDLPRGPGWAWDDEPDPTAMSISALSLNSNTVGVTVRPGRRAGDSALVAIDPPTAFTGLENEATTDTAGARSTIDVTRNWREHLNTVIVRGKIPPGDTAEATAICIADPHWYTLTVFRERLEAWGIRCGGLVLDTVPRGAAEYASCEHRLDSVLVFMNHESDNLAAENILKTIAAVKTGLPGTTAAGAEYVDLFLAGLGIDTTNIVIADGSGVSRYNLTSASTITALLEAMKRRTDLFPAWYASLPVAGRSGTIARRMRGTPAEGNIRAKTGTLSGVSALSGYVTTADGEELAFSILMQNYPSRAGAYRRAQDRIGALLAGMKRSEF